MAEATERFSGRSQRRTSRGPEAERQFDVTGVSDVDEALDHLAGVGLESSGETIRLGDTHPSSFGLAMYVQDIGGDMIQPNWAQIDANYAFPQFGGAPPQDQVSDPLNEPLRFQFVDGETREPVDADSQGNPIVNSSRVPFSRQPTDLFPDFRLVVIRNEPFFDFGLAVDMKLAINDDDLVVGGVNFAPRLSARLIRMRPVAEFTLNQLFVPVRYEFALRNPAQSPQDVTPHALRIADIGWQARGKTEDASSGNNLPGNTVLRHMYETDEGGNPIQPINTQAKLDGHGAPADGRLAIGEEDLTAAELNAPPGATLEEPENDPKGAHFLWYQGPNMKRKLFSRLGLNS